MTGQRQAALTELESASMFGRKGQKLNLPLLKMSLRKVVKTLERPRGTIPAMVGEARLEVSSVQCFPALPVSAMTYLLPAG
jgi:hypothetical protein